MAKFLKTIDQNSAISKIIENAKKKIIIISPYIHLGEHHKNALKLRAEDHKVQLTIVFRKNEIGPDPLKNIHKEDLELFKSFKNVVIGYDSKIHAKFYGNEKEGLSTSMNLYDYSHNNNKEIGIYVKKRLINKKIINLKDNESDNQFSLYAGLIKITDEIIHQADNVFRNKPFFTTNILGFKKYKESKDTYYLNEENLKTQSNINISEPEMVNEQSKTIVDSEKHHGYCIKTGEKISFNLKKPLCPKAYKEWANSRNEIPKNEYVKGFYCHFSGEETKEKNTFKKPILFSNWDIANQIYKLNKTIDK